MDAVTAVCQKIDKLLSEKLQVTVGIDGPAASGKTTLAAGLEKMYGCPVIHMDHFFLPPELRTPRRYSEPGGNIHYERFTDEVALRLKSGKSFTYRIFDCGKLDYNGAVSINPVPLTVIEGSYCLSNRWQDIYDLKIMLQISSDRQLSRLKKRINDDPVKKENSEEILRRFTETWIPLENEYFRQLTVEPDLIF